MLTQNNYHDLKPTTLSVYLRMPICEFLSHASFSHCQFTLWQHRNGQSKKTLQEFISHYKDKWPNTAHRKFTNETNMETLHAILLDQEHGFTIHIPLPNASNTDTRVEGNVPGTVNMGDFSSTPPSSMVMFNSVKAPGEFKILYLCSFTLSHPLTFF
jgi:hypothetical protein